MKLLDLKSLWLTANINCYENYFIFNFKNSIAIVYNFLVYLLAFSSKDSLGTFNKLMYFPALIYSGKTQCLSEWRKNLLLNVEEESS